jgi:CRISPR-associated exonuclease Cas4
MANSPEYTAAELLPLSGLQHFCFCRRQWALIHIELQWKDNALTVDGKQMHERVDDPFFTEKRKEGIITRSLPVVSYRLGLSGICDVVEFLPDAHGAQLYGHAGRYFPHLVEYKHGKEKADHSDEVQLCAQALCLEEMLSVHIPAGSLFYGRTRRRSEVEFTPELRALVEKYAEEMHAYFRRGYTPQVKPSAACHSCSLADLCLPELQKKTLSARKYIQMHIDEA